MFESLKSLRWPVLLAGLVLLTVPSLQAQAVGSIQGTVADSTGGVLPGVEVSVTNTDTGVTRVVITNDSGRYRAPNLPLGTYSVSAELTGFKTSSLAGIHLTVGATITANLSLEIGEVSEVVNVVGGEELVDTTSITMQSLVDEVKIRELPLNGRDYYRLALLQPGTTQMRGQRQVRISPQTGTGLNMSISGSRPNSNTFRVDGIVANDAAGSSPGSISGENLGVDAIREFAVMSSTYGAEYGRGAGGVVNSAIRSGTNEWHGSLHYFHRNHVLDARNFFDGEDSPPFRRHQFGATGGGALMQDRVFIFGAYEQLEQFRGETSVAQVPTPLAKSGVVIGGADGTVGNADDSVPIPTTAAQQAFITKYPDPNGAISGDTGSFSHAPGFDVEAKFFTLRSDIAMNDANNVSLSYLVEDGDILQRDGLDRSSLKSFSVRQLFAVNVTSVLSPAVINNVRIGYSRPYGATGALVSDFEEFNVPSPALSFVPNRPPGILTISGVEQFFTGFESEDTEGLLMQSTQVFEDVSWTLGDHDLKFGFNVEFDAPRVDAANRENGEYRFSGWREFLLDMPQDFRAQFPGSDTRRFFRQNLWGGYIQDNIQLNEKLSINLGLRFEFAEDVQELDGQSARARFGDDFTTGPTTVAEFTIGQGFFGDMPIWELGNFAPRFGFAYDVFGDGRTAIRGGFGVYGEMILTPFLNLPGLRMPPFFNRGTSRASDQERLAGTFPTGGFDIFAEAADDAGVLTIDPIEVDPPQAYRMQFNLNVQQQLASNTVFQIGYVGALGRNFGSTQRDVNLAQESFRDGRLFFASGQSERNPNYTRLGPRLFDGNNSYHGLQLGLNRRFTEGLRIQASYTWSKTLDEGSNVFSQNQFDNGISNPFFEISEYAKGHADFHIGQSFVLNGTYDVPNLGDGGVGHWVNGWQIGGVVSLIGGVPVTPRQDDDRMNTLVHSGGSQIGHRVDENGNGNDGEPSGSVPKNQIFDPRQFAPSLIACSNGETTNGNCEDLGPGITKVGGFAGEVGRNTVIGDGLVTVDLVLTKNTHLSEDVNLQFRWEIFNLFNNVNFDSPVGNLAVAYAGNDGTTAVGCVDGGGCTSGSAFRTLTRSREMQVGLKLIF